MTTHRPYALARHSFALAGRNLTKMRRNPGLFTDAVMLPVIFLLLFVYLFGGAVAGSTQDYLQYVFPGVLVMTAILTGMTSTGLSINLDIKKGVFDRFRSLPIPRSAPLIGSVLGDGVRYVIAVGSLFVLGFVLGFRVQTDVLSALAAAGLAVLFGFALSWVNVLIGVVVKEETLVTTIAFLGIFPLAFGTDMVAPTETLPGWLQAWVDINPVTHVMDATSALLLDEPLGSSVVATLAWSAAFLVVFVPLAVRAYQRRV
ncbi:ABC transporter permease [Jiangella gansuensis]|uniref:ABC transporter permease n=1 Tax=Jiangella gansuensis TaxID=281473 RepID=UPI000478A59E|nr:ABC transporter permease [Jiangella gansuensis]